MIYDVDSPEYKALFPIILPHEDVPPDEAEYKPPPRPPPRYFAQVAMVIPETESRKPLTKAYCDQAAARLQEALLNFNYSDSTQLKKLVDGIRFVGEEIRKQRPLFENEPVGTTSLSAFRKHNEKAKNEIYLDFRQHPWEIAQPILRLHLYFGIMIRTILKFRIATSTCVGKMTSTNNVIALCTQEGIDPDPNHVVDGEVLITITEKNMHMNFEIQEM